MRRVVFVVILLGAAVALAQPGSGAVTRAAASANTWSGRWDRAGVGQFDVTQNGTAITGVWHWGTGGTLQGTLQPDGSVVGTWSGGNSSVTSGSINWNPLSADGKSFTGTTSYGSETRSWGGACVSGPCTNNGTAGSSPAPPPAPVPATTPPVLGKETVYQPPAAGATATYPLPAVPKGKHVLTGALSFVDNEGNPVAPPDVAAVELQDAKAVQICGILLAGTYSDEQRDKDLETYGMSVPAVYTCVATVAQVLARAEQIEKAKGASTAAQAAAFGCTVFVHDARVVRPTIHLTCTSTSTGMTIGLSPLSSRQTLSQAFAGHPPKLIIGRSNVTSTPAGVSFGVLWRAH